MLRHACGFTPQYGSLVQGGKEFYAAGVGDAFIAAIVAPAGN
jgi:hypothetical protein